MFPQIKIHLDSFDALAITEERKAVLQPLVTYIQNKKKKQQSFKH